MTRKLVLMAALLALSACNTVSGVGQDISSGANHVAGWIGF